MSYKKTDFYSYSPMGQQSFTQKPKRKPKQELSEVKKFPIAKNKEIFEFSRIKNKK